MNNQLLFGHQKFTSFIKIAPQQPLVYHCVSTCLPSLIPRDVLWSR